MIEDKIIRYKENLILAQKLVNNQYADHVYYEKLVSRFKKMLIFYENLKVWEDNLEK